jgi:biotin carboxyl carrier protein
VKLEIELDGRTRTVEIGRAGARLECRIDGRAVAADATEVAPGIYSILIGNISLEARVEPGAGTLHVVVAGRRYSAEVRDPRRWRRDQKAALAAEGRQQVVAPMSGKIVGVLVKAGERVEAGQGILVIEAMKMQNEVRSPKAGTVERLLVSENQAVNAGETLAMIV